MLSGAGRGYPPKGAQSPGGAVERSPQRVLAGLRPGKGPYKARLPCGEVNTGHLCGFGLQLQYALSLVEARWRGDRWGFRLSALLFQWPRFLLRY
jgi:hypothetical protein